MAERIEIVLTGSPGQGGPAPGQPGYAPPEPKPYTPPSPAAPPTQTQQAGAPEAPPQARQTAQEGTPPEGIPAWQMYAPPAPTPPRDEQQGVPAFEIGPPPPVVIQAPPPPELPVPDARNDDGAYDRSLAEAWKMAGPEVPPPEPWKMAGPEVPPPEPYQPPPVPELQPPEMPEPPPPQPRDEMADSYARAAEEARRKNAEDNRREKLLAEAMGPPPEEKEEKGDKGKGGVDWFRAGQVVTSGAGQMAASAGGLDAGGVVQSGLGSASALAASLGEPISAAVLTGLNTAFGGAKAFADNLNALGNRLADYSSELSQSQAQSEIAQILGDMKRADMAGKELAEMQLAYSKLSQASQDVMMKIMVEIAPTLTEFLKNSAQFANALPGFWEAFRKNGWLGAAKISDLIDAWKAAQREDKADDEEFDTSPKEIIERFFGPGGFPGG